MVTYIGPNKENQLTKEQLIEDDPYDLKTLLSLYESHKLWNIVYERLKNRSTVFNSEVTYEAARDVHNRWKNRYRDIIPYDSTRVILDSGCVGNYINASYVEVPIAPSRRYILTQGPMQQTSSHFWLMVWERRSPAIVMLNRIFEKGLMKCHPYFPQKCFHPTLYFDDVDLRIKINVEVTHRYFVKRILCISNTRTDEQHEVVHLHYTNWPDFGVPFSPSGLLDFLWIVRSSGALDNPKHPPVIHCSAGVGRSGAFVLIDLALHLVEVLGNIRGTDLAELFVELRRCRMGIIQTAEQLRFCYCAIVQGTEAILSVPPEEISSIRFSPNSREVNGSDASADEGWDGMMEEEDDSSSEDLEKIENNEEGLLGPSGLTTETEVRLLSRYNAFEQMSPVHVPDDATESDSDFSSSVLRIRNSPWISSSYPSNTSDEVIQQNTTQYMISAAIAAENSPHLISSTFSGADGKFHHCSGPVDEDLLDTTHLDRCCTLAVMKEDSDNSIPSLMSSERNTRGDKPLTQDIAENLNDPVPHQDVFCEVRDTDIGGLGDDKARITDGNETITDPLTDEYLAASRDLNERRRARRLRRDRVRESIEAIRERMRSENLERKRFLPVSVSFYMRRFFTESGYIQGPVGAILGASVILALTVGVSIAIYSHWFRT